MAADVALLGIEIDPTRALRAFGRVGSAAVKTSAKVIGVTTRMAKRFVSFGVKAGLAAAAIAVAFAKMGADFEEAMIGVQKTSGLSEKAIAKLGKEFRELAKTIPKSAKQLAAIGQVAGQLGIQNSRDILTFTETIAKIATVTDFAEEEAAESLARLSNIFGEPIKNVEKLGSALNELENTTTATASRIANFTQRLAVASTQIGLTISETTGIAATLIDLGFNAELAGTAVSTTFTAMISDAETFGSQMGLTAKQFRTALKKDAIGTILEWAKAMQALPIEEMIAALGEVGIEGSRARSVFGALTKNTKLLATNVQTSNRAFREGLSLQKEFDTAVSATNQQFKLMVNSLSEIGIKIGGVLLGPANLLIDRFKNFLDDLPLSSRAIADVLSKAFDIMLKGIVVVNQGLKILIDSLGAVAKAVLFVAEKFNEMAVTRKNNALLVQNALVENIQEKIIKRQEKINSIRERLESGTIRGRTEKRFRQEIDLLEGQNFLAQTRLDIEKDKLLVLREQVLAQISKPPRFTSGDVEENTTALKALLGEGFNVAERLLKVSDKAAQDRARRLSISEIFEQVPGGGFGGPNSGLPGIPFDRPLSADPNKPFISHRGIISENFPPDPFDDIGRPRPDRTLVKITDDLKEAEEEFKKLARTPGQILEEQIAVIDKLASAFRQTKGEFGISDDQAVRLREKFRKIAFEDSGEAETQRRTEFRLKTVTDIEKSLENQNSILEKRVSGEQALIPMFELKNKLAEQDIFLTEKEEAGFQKLIEKNLEFNKTLDNRAKLQAARDITDNIQFEIELTQTRLELGEREVKFLITKMALEQARDQRLSDREEIKIRKLLDLQDKLNEKLKLQNDIIGIGERVFDRFGNGIVESMQRGEGAMESFKRASLAALFDIQRELFKLFIFEPFKQAVIGGITGFFGSGGSSSSGTGGIGVNVFDSFGDLIGPSSKGNVFFRGSMIPFAMGGVVDHVSAFPLNGGRNIGTIAERGPEAIMPLKRLSGGQLGVQATGIGGNVQVTVNIINQTGAQVETQQSSNGRGGVDIDVMIRKSVASDINNGGMVFKAIKQTTGVGAQTIGR